jgi:hypothetical protein
MARKRRIDLEKGRFSLLAINRFFGNIPNFFAEQRAKRAAAGRSESVGILFKMSSNFFQQTPPNRKFRPFSELKN